MRIFLALLLFTCTLAIRAEIGSQGSQTFGNYEIHYSIFPSSFVLPEVASAAGIKRSKYESLINVSVTPKGQYGGLPVALSGTVTNLMQQQKVLTFKEIREQSAVYYLAPIRIAGEEVVHIELKAQPTDSPAMTLKFSTRLYPDN